MIETIKEFCDRIESESYIDNEKKLKKQKKEALKFVNQVETALQEKNEYWMFPLKLIKRRIKPYVQKYCFLPYSYHAMLTDWLEMKQKGILRGESLEEQRGYLRTKNPVVRKNILGG